MKPIVLGAGAALALLIAGSALASPAQNKEAAVNAMTDLFSRQDPTGVDRYFTTPYRQHNMHLPDGLAVLKGLAQAATKWKGVHTDIRRGLADGDFVVLHSVYWNLLDLHQHSVAFDLFRFQDGKIVEHWDCLEPVDDKAGRPNAFDGPVAITDRDKTEANRTVVAGFIDGVLVGGGTDQSGQFIDRAAYIEHRPAERRLFDAVKPDLSTPVIEGPDVRYVKLHRTVAEGNFVFAQSEGRMNGQIIELYDLFRLKNGKIVEHWDIHQPVPPQAQWINPNGPF